MRIHPDGQEFRRWIELNRKWHLTQEDRELFASELKKLKAVSRLKESANYRQHGTTSIYAHSVGVAYVSLILARRYRIKVEAVSMIRGALLHDYFLYDWHDAPGEHRLHGFRHPGFALKNAERDVPLNEIERDVIKRHMFPLTPVPPKYRESVLVSIADKICAAKEFAHGMTGMLRPILSNG